MPNRILKCEDCGKTKETHANKLCRTCYQRRARKANPEKNREHARLNYYRHREVKLVKARERDAKRKEEKALYDKEYRTINLDKRHNQSHEWHESHRNELTAKRFGCSVDTIISVLHQNLEKYGQYRCECCGAFTGEDYHIDHIMPLSLGGNSTHENLQLLCRICNPVKGTKIIDYRSRTFEDTRNLKQAVSDTCLS